jgi:hypothetical protein
MPDGSIALRRDDSCGFDAIFAAIGLSRVDVVDPVGVPEVEPDDVPLVDPPDDVPEVDPDDVPPVDPVGVVVVEPEGAVDVLCGLPCVEAVVVFGLPLVFGLPVVFWLVIFGPLVVFGPVVIDFALVVVGLVDFGLPCGLAGALGPWVCGAAPFGPDAVTGAVVSDAIATTLRASRLAYMAVSLRPVSRQGGYPTSREMWTIIGRNCGEGDVGRDRIGSFYTLFE